MKVKSKIIKCNNSNYAIIIMKYMMLTAYFAKCHEKCHEIGCGNNAVIVLK